MKRADVIIIAAIALCCGALFLALSRGGAGARAVICAPQGTMVVELSADRSLEVGGALGTLAVEISGGAIRILDAPCPDKLCIRMGAQDRAGHAIICLPSRVSISIEGSGQWDALSQ